MYRLRSQNFLARRVHDRPDIDFVQCACAGHCQSVCRDPKMHLHPKNTASNAASLSRRKFWIASAVASCSAVLTSKTKPLIGEGKNRVKSREEGIYIAKFRQLSRNQTFSTSKEERFGGTKATELWRNGSVRSLWSISPSLSMKMPLMIVSLIWGNLDLFNLQM